MKLLIRLAYFLNKLRYRITRPLTMGVRLILIKNESILLVKHSYQPLWYIPGGGIKKNETIQQAAKREAAEEIGADLKKLDLLGIYSNFYEYKSDHVVVFSCNDFSLNGKIDFEIESFEFFAFDKLPKDISPGSLRRVNEYLNQNNIPIVEIW